MEATRNQSGPHSRFILPLVLFYKTRPLSSGTMSSRSCAPSPRPRTSTPTQVRLGDIVWVAFNSGARTTALRLRLPRAHAAKLCKTLSFCHPGPARRRQRRHRRGGGDGGYARRAVQPHPNWGSTRCRLALHPARTPRPTRCIVRVVPGHLTKSRNISTWHISPRSVWRAGMEPKATRAVNSPAYAHQKMYVQPATHLLLGALRCKVASG